MRTTIRLNDSLLREAKKHALEQGRTLTDLIESALRLELSRKTAGQKTFRIPTQKGRIRSGIDLDDSGSLLDRMEDR